MSVLRSSIHTRVVVPGVSRIETPKRLRTESGDSICYNEESNQTQNIEHLISSTIEREIAKIGEAIKSSIAKTMEESLKSLEIDLSDCKTHHSDIKVLKQDHDILKSQIQTLESENKFLKEKVQDLEQYLRRKNIKLLGVQDSQGSKSCKQLVLQLFQSVGLKIDPRDIIQAHRIGRSSRIQPIIVQMLYPETIEDIFKLRGALKDKRNVTVVKDLPDSTHAARKVLVPVLHEAKRIQIPGHASAKLSGNFLLLNGKRYSIKNLSDLPDVLQPSRVFTPEKANQVAFFTKFSPLSNHHQSPFSVEGKHFNCMEQFLMCSKAIMFNDLELSDRILGTTDPVVQKSLGRNVKGFNKAVWQKRCNSIMEAGLVAKFGQNPALKEFLLRTKDKQIIEANANDTYWSCGWPLSLVKTSGMLTAGGEKMSLEIYSKISERPCKTHQ